MGYHVPVKRISGWREADGYPSGEEFDEHGIELSDDESELLCEHFPISGEKLGGWPNWVQGAEYPECPECQRRMELLFQIDSEGNLPFMFGDTGCGHVTYCPDHRGVFAFGWACC